MSPLTIVGGVYHERCIWPDWDQLYGSGGRAAAALSGQVDELTLRTYARADTAERFDAYVVGAYRFNFEPTAADQTVSFEYVHSLSSPTIRPAPPLIRQNKLIAVSSDIVLRFGLMEGSGRVDAKFCVYDPQSVFDPRPFAENGSTAERLAIVANQQEIAALGGRPDPIESASALVADGAELVVVKCGVAGAYVVDRTNCTPVPAYQTERVWTIGSGDVFAAMFAVAWGMRNADPIQAAKVASRAVAEYVNSMALPCSSPYDLERSSLSEARAVGGRVYLAGPFFTISQRWLIDEARRCLTELGLNVFSPVHEIGHGPAETIAPADLAAIDQCDIVFAILDGIDSNTVFEIGHARARGKPVYVLAQTVSEEDLKMVVGSGCRVFDDFVTALHHTAWRA